MRGKNINTKRRRHVGEQWKETGEAVEAGEREMDGERGDEGAGC